MGDFFFKHKMKIIVGIVALLLGAMIYSASIDGVNNIGTNLISMITKPFLVVTSSVGSAVDDFFNKYFSSAKYMEENETLKSEINELNEKLIDYDTIKQENEALKKIAGIKDKNKNATYLPATIISRDPYNLSSTFTIDKGQLDGIKVNSPIITEGGLVGIVSSVTLTTSTVTTILNPKLNIGVYSAKTKEIGIISGDTKLAEKGQANFSILSKETKLVKGDLLITSGSSGIYPKDVPVGKIIKVSSQEHGVTLKANIKPCSDIVNLKDVIVITSFLGQGNIIDELE